MTRRNLVKARRVAASVVVAGVLVPAQAQAAKTDMVSLNLAFSCPTERATNACITAGLRYEGWERSRWLTPDPQLGLVSEARVYGAGNTVSKPSSFEFDMEGDSKFETSSRPVYSTSQESCVVTVWECKSALPIGYGVSTGNFIRPNLARPQVTVGVKTVAPDGSIDLQIKTLPVPARRMYATWKNKNAAKPSQIVMHVWGRPLGTQGGIAHIDSLPVDDDEYTTDLEAGSLVGPQTPGVASYGINNAIALVSEPRGQLDEMSNDRWAYRQTAPFTHRDGYVVGFCQTTGSKARLKVQTMLANGQLKTKRITLRRKGDGVLLSRSPKNFRYTPPKGWCSRVVSVKSGS